MLKEYPDFDLLLDAVAGAIGETRRQVEVPLLNKIAALSARIEELEHRPQLLYRGVWQAGTQYNENSVVTHSGSMWHCNESTNAKPGTSEHWQLCVKAGRNGRDLAKVNG